MFRHLILGTLAPALMFAAAPTAEACRHRCQSCSSAPAPCSACNDACEGCTAAATKEVEKTVMVPTIVTETRKIAVTKYRDDARTLSYTVTKNVPQTLTREIAKTQMVPEVRTRKIETFRCRPVLENKEVSYTVNVPEKITRTIEYTVRQPVYTQREVEYTVNVPTTETRTGLRAICRMAPVVKTRTIKQDLGHWEIQAVEQQVAMAPEPKADAQLNSAEGEKVEQHLTAGREDTAADPCCNPDPCAMVERKVWVPNVQTREVEYTTKERVIENEEFTYDVTVYRPEIRTRLVTDCTYVTEERTREVEQTVYRPETRTKTIQVTRYVREPQTREEQYTVMIPQTKTATEEYTVIKQVPETRTRNYTIKVPYTEEQEVPVKVCRMVAKTIKVRVPVSTPCCD